MSKLVPLLETIFMNRGGSSDLWRASSKVINSKPEEAKYFISYIKMKLKDMNQEIQLLALDILDYLAVEGKMPVHTQIAAKDFLTTLISLLKTRDAPEVQVKILYLIRKWGLRFENQKDILPNFFEVYSTLKNSGVVFPEQYEANYMVYVQAESNDHYSGSNYNEPKPQSQGNVKGNNFNQVNDYNSNPYIDSVSNEVGQYSTGVKLDLSPENYDKKYKKFVGELGVLLDNINLANEMMDNMEGPIDEGLRTIIHNLRELEKNLVIAIQDKIKHEKLLDICLGINDDINRTFTRYDAIKAGKKPVAFVSSFTDTYSHHNNFKQSNNSTNMNKNNQRQNNNNSNTFEVFNQPSSNTNTNSNVNNSGQNKAGAQNVNDIFDIFNAPVTTTTTNVQPNLGGDVFNMSGNNNFQNTQTQQVKQQDPDVFNMVNSANNSGANFNQMNQQSNYQEKKQVNLEDLLKNAYSNNSMQNTNTNTNTMNSNMNVNMNTGYGVNQPGSTMSFNTMMNSMNDPFQSQMGGGVPNNMGFSQMQGGNSLNTNQSIDMVNWNHQNQMQMSQMNQMNQMGQMGQMHNMNMNMQNQQQQNQFGMPNNNMMQSNNQVPNNGNNGNNNPYPNFR